MADSLHKEKLKIILVIPPPFYAGWVLSIPTFAADIKNAMKLSQTKTLHWRLLVALRPVRFNVATIQVM